MYLADSWKDPSVLVAVASVLATVIIGVVAAIVAKRAALPKRQLGFFLSKSAQLLTPSAGLANGRLVITYDGNVLADPYIAEIKMLNDTGRDIPSSLFDSGAPIVMDLGVPIVELIEATWEDWKDGSGPVRVTPQVTVDGTTLTIQPTLIAAHLMTTFTLLVEGAPTFDLRAPLVDVDVDVKRLRPRRSLPSDGTGLNYA